MSKSTISTEPVYLRLGAVEPKLEEFFRVVYDAEGIARAQRSTILREFIELGLKEKIRRLPPEKRRRLQTV